MVEGESAMQRQISFQDARASLKAAQSVRFLLPRMLLEIQEARDFLEPQENDEDRQILLLGELADAAIFVYALAIHTEKFHLEDPLEKIIESKEDNSAALTFEELEEQIVALQEDFAETHDDNLLLSAMRSVTTFARQHSQISFADVIHAKIAFNAQRFIPHFFELEPGQNPVDAFDKGYRRSKKLLSDSHEAWVFFYKTWNRYSDNFA